MNQQSHTALEWVKDALTEVLDGVVRDLDAMALQPSADVSGLVGPLQQVTGILHMTELAEPALLADELRKLANGLPKPADAQAVQRLRDGAKLLRLEIDRLHHSQRNPSVAVYRMLRHLHALNPHSQEGEKIHWQAGLPDALDVLGGQPWGQIWANAARERLHIALRQQIHLLLKGQHDSEVWQRLGRACKWLATCSTVPQQAARWHVAAWLAQEHADANRSPDASLLALLVRLERSVPHAHDELLLVDVLIALARLQPLHAAESRRLVILAGLQEDKEAADSAVLTRVHRCLVQASDAQHPSAAQLLWLDEAVHLLQSHGWQQLADQAQTLRDAWAAAPQPEAAPDVQPLIEQVKRIEGLETDAAGHLQAVDDARRSAVRAARVALENAKNLLTAHAARAGAAGTSHLDDMLPELDQVRGFFVLLGLTHAAHITEKINQLVALQQHAPLGQPNWQQLDLLADMVSGVEYYLDRLAQQHQDQAVLDRIGQRLDDFGRLQLRDHPPAPLGDQRFDDNTPDEVVDALSNTALAAAPVGQVEAATPASAVADPIDAGTNADAVEQDAAAAGQDSAAAAAPTQHGGLPMVALGDLPELPEDDFDQDPDIQEIFIEEAEEVLEGIGDTFARWSSNPSDTEALRDLRRGFHTLKGSGRMVGARVVGELAWSIENLLNRVMDGSVAPGGSVFEVIEQARGLVPILVADYAASKVASHDPRPLMAVAGALATGQVLKTPAPDAASNRSPAVASLNPATPTDASAAPNQASHADDLGPAEIPADLNPTNHPDVAAVQAPGGDSRPQTTDAKPQTHGMDEPAFANTPGGAETQEPISLQADQAEEDAFDQLSAALNAELGAAPAVDADIDEQLLDIFVSEAREHLRSVELCMAAMPEGGEASDDLIRALHTLCGSAAMTGVEPISQLSKAMEMVCRRARDHQVPLEIGQMAQLQAVHDHVLKWVDQTEQGLVCAMDPAARQLLDALGGHALGKEPSITTGSTAELLALDIDALLDADFAIAEVDEADAGPWVDTLIAQIDLLRQTAVAAHQPQAVELSGALLGVHQALVTQADRLHDADVEPVLVQGYQAVLALMDDLAAGIRPSLDADTMRQLADLQQRLNPADTNAAAWVQQPAQGDGSIAPPVIRAPGGNAAHPPPAAATAAEVKQPIEAMANGLASAEAPLAAPVTRAAVVDTAQAPAPIKRRLDQRHDADLLPVFLEEAHDLDAQIGEGFAQWLANPTDVQPLAALQRHLHTLKGGARMAQVASVGDLAHEVETIYELLGQQRIEPTPVLQRFVQHVQDLLSQQIEQLGDQGTSFYCPDELSALRGFVQTRQERILNQFFEGESTALDSTAPPAAVLPVSSPAPVATKAPAPAAQGLSPLQDMAAAWEEGQTPDADLLGIFLEEAEEIVEDVQSQLQHWITEPTDVRTLAELQRGLHTLKGGARMVQVSSIGDLAHELESIYEQLVAHPGLPNPLLPALLNMAHQWLEQAILVLKRGERPLLPAPLLQAVADYVASADSLTQLPQFEAQTAATQAPAVIEHTAADGPARAVSGTGMVSVSSGRSKPPSMHGEFVHQTSMDTVAGETLRVSAQVVEKMINLSGEDVINRSRVEMQNNSVASTLEEMGATIQRLADQLRRMEGELETQILARHEEEHGVDADFDPLEMDQYSSLNQLSKSLFESASDLMDLRVTLRDKINDAEALLLQQARIQSELQEELMNARLVPFARTVPRLQRVVRQVANELGKPAELVINNAEGELDRTILDRIVAPLEHMLRNAVDHGLETPEDRQAAGKPAQGRITLDINREGNEIVLTLADDGRGIDVNAVRQKAIERRVIGADDLLSNTDVLQLIFHAGLSTANKVTQISGRGVGMDVVQSEVKQLGGTVSVESTAGQGTRFNLRVPVSVAVTDALMVQIGERTFAVPLGQIERLVRVPAATLAEAYAKPKPEHQIGNVSYPLRYLGEYVHGQSQPTLEQHLGSLPVLLVRNDSALLALQVDQLVGSRTEIVIKPIGQQLSTVQGVAGATILGDGSVVVILDVNNLARLVGAQRWKAVGEQRPLQQRAARRLIMVVDDSVTVRKVTTRFLEREGFDVITAKDGADAMLKLEDTTPDLMLLDIEMPRMDGFEVATQVRHNSRLSSLPIIMITSRTGEKHRERAFQVGVDGYMGKPFNEQLLLENIRELLSVGAD